MRSSSRRWRSPGRLIAIALLVAASACAPKTPPVTTMGAPRYPDFIFPAVPPASADPSFAGDGLLHADHDRAWRLLQAGEFRGAEREFQLILKRRPGFYPAEAGLGYLDVAQRRFKEALTWFDRAIARSASYAPALAGRGEVLLGMSREGEALSAFEAALTADPSLVDVRRRIEVLRFAQVRNLVASAKRASEAGRFDEARREYERAIAATPASAFLYRDLAAVELHLDADAAAAGHLKKATELDPGDARAWLALAELLERQGDFDGAVGAFEHALAIEPADSTRAALARVREGMARVKLPEEYRAIPGSARLTRGELAALLGVRFQEALAASPRRVTAVMTDARQDWAAPWIMAVTRAGVMDVYQNHTFQPRAVVRRVDLAHVVARMLDVVAPGAPRTLDGARRTIADVGPGYVGYKGIVAAVASGVMPLFEGDSFRPSRVVSGAEAVEAMNRLQALSQRGRAGRSGT